MASKKHKNRIDNDLHDFLFDGGNQAKPAEPRPVTPANNRPAGTPNMTRSTASDIQSTRRSTVSKRQAQEAAKAKELAELRARIDAEVKAKEAAEAKAKKAAELKAKQEAEAKAKKAAELKAKQAAEAKAKQVAELKAKQEAELRAKQAAEEKAKQEAELKAKKLAELKARQAELKAKQEAELKAKQEAEAKAKRIEELKARQAELKAKQEADAKRKRLEELKALKESRVKQEAEDKAKRIAELKARQERMKAEQQAQYAAIRAAQNANDPFSPRRSSEAVRRESEANQARMHEELLNIMDSPSSKSSTDTVKDTAKQKPKTQKKPGKPKNMSLKERIIYIFDNIPEERSFLQKIFLPKTKPVTVKDKSLLAARYMALMCAFMVFLGSSYILFAIATAPKIDPANIYDHIAQSSTLYDMNGEELCTVDAGQDRTIVQYDELPEDLVNAVVALEDKTFWKHHGFNWVRIFGAILQSFTSGDGISGTSTITQQLARNVYLPEIKSERSLKRKIIEMYYAAKIEHTLSKEYIFAAYINSIYFGFGNYGAEAAANTYFSKHISDLDLVECATLASLPQSPDAYAPLEYMSAEALSGDNTSIIDVDGTDYVVNDIAKNRRKICMQLMYDQGYITEDTLMSNSDIDLKDYINPTIKEDDSNVASYFKEFAMDQVTEDLMTQYNITREEATNMVYGGGLEIYTTMDRDAQESIEKSFEDDSYFPGYTNLNKNDNGDVVTESGDISLYNSENYFSKNGNFVLKPGEFTLNDDGSLTITSHKRLYFYETEVASGIDWSIEFKPFYEIKDDKMYIHQGGYLNIPTEAKTIDNNDNITISKEFMEENAEYLHLSSESDKDFVIQKELFTVEPGVVQPQAAMVIVEVGTGELKAMVGGRGIKGSNLYNRATGTRQPGSSLKPLAVYSAALQKSFEYAEKGQKFEYTDYHIDKQGTSKYGDYLTAASIVTDEPTKIEGKIWPTNATGSYSGNITMRRALQMSVNVSAVKLYLQVGKEYSADMVEKFGITTLERSGEYSDLNPSGLGMGGLSNGVSALEMAQAYTTFPNGGSRNTTIAYTKVVDREGSTILRSESESIKVLDEGVAFIMTDMLKSVVTKGIAGNAKVSGVEVGGKTGTTSSNYDIWFDGFTPHYAAALWIGSDVNITLTSDSSSAARLWSKVMSAIPAAKEGEYRDMPSNVVKYGGEYFTKGTETGHVTVDDDTPEEVPLPEPSDGSNWIDPGTNDEEEIPEETPDKPEDGGGDSGGDTPAPDDGGNGGTPIEPPPDDPGTDPGGGEADTPDAATQ